MQPCPVGWFQIVDLRSPTIVDQTEFEQSQSFCEQLPWDSSTTSYKFNFNSVQFNIGLFYENKSQNKIRLQIYHVKYNVKKDYLGGEDKQVQ